MTRQTHKKGLFVSFEGGEGAGKSTQILALVQALRSRGMAVVETREPGGTPAAEALRDVFIHNKGHEWPPAALLLLMFSARVLHVETLIKPALDRGEVVVCDRFTDSSRVYQGYAGSLGIEMVETIRRAVLGDFEPDLTFILDVDPAVGLARSARRGSGTDTFEDKDLSFHQRLRDGYRTIAAANPDRCVLIDATMPIEDIAACILFRVMEEGGCHV